MNQNSHFHLQVRYFELILFHSFLDVLSCLHPLTDLTSRIRFFSKLKKYFVGFSPFSSHFTCDLKIACFPLEVMERTSRTSGNFEIASINGSSSERLLRMDNYTSRDCSRYSHLTEPTTSAGLLPGLVRNEKSGKLEKIKINKSKKNDESWHRLMTRMIRNLLEFKNLFATKIPLRDFQVL